MLKPETFIKRHGFLLVAFSVMLVATLMLAVIQFFAVKRTAAEKQAALEANLDLQLYALVNEARRDMYERASYITHSLPHTRMRKRDIEGMAQRYTQAMRRYPEMRQLYAVFFERGTDADAWRVFRYVPTDSSNPNMPLYKGIPVGNLVEDAEAATALREAWLSIPDRSADATYAAYAPVSSPQKEQIFFHPVYEPDHLNRQSDLDRIGLFVFTPDANNYPAPDYLKNLAEQFEKKETSDSPNALAINIRIRGDDEKIIAESQIAPLRTRGFDPNDRLFPNLEFGVAPRNPNSFSDDTTTSFLLGLSATLLALFGLALTWRATQREWRVAQMKSDFVASVSHELKTPLTAIRAFGDLLASGRTQKPGRVREYGSLIIAESNRLNSLLNDILEMSQMERGARRYQFQMLDLRETIEKSIETFQHTSAATDFEITIDLPAAPVFAEFDENAVRQIVLNLLSNAAKYSNGTKVIETSLKTENGAARLTVKDYGIGIAAGEQVAVFTPFHRADDANVQNSKGTGLGLAIVREIVAAHGGEISVKSKPGAGAVFSVKLPIRK